MGSLRRRGFPRKCPYYGHGTHRRRPARHFSHASAGAAVARTAHRGARELLRVVTSAFHDTSQHRVGRGAPVPYCLGPTEVLSGGWLLHVPLFALGLHPLVVGAMMAVNLFYQFWLHTDIIGRLGPLEWVFNTPSHHRVHHASNAEYLDRNYGGILIIWDRLFGTFAREQPQIAIAYGLAHPIGSMNPVRIALHEWGAMAADVRRARSWRERFRQLFGRPGVSLLLVEETRP